MYRTVTLLLLFLFPIYLEAQSTRQTLKGYIALEGGESFTYKIVFTDSADHIKGYSLTYLQEANETKATISGRIDREKHTLTFRETSIIYNHGFQSNTIMCLVSATLKYTHTNSGYVLTGHFTGADASSTYCGKGTVSFVNTDVLKELFDNSTKDTLVSTEIRRPASHSVPVRPSSIIVEEAAPPATSVQIISGDKITNNVEKTYEWHSDSMVMDVWGEGNIISIQINGTTVLNTYMLSQQHKELRLPVSKTGTDIVTIVANNEGNDLSNTANIILRDGNTTHNVVAYNRVGQKAIIRIKRAAAN